MPKEIKEKIEESGSLCGGVISESKFKSNPWADMMAYVMPDKQFNKYLVFKKQKKEKEATKLFNKYAYSQI